MRKFHSYKSMSVENSEFEKFKFRIDIHA